MIIRQTEKYNVNTKAVLNDAIESAFIKSQAVLPKEAPDKFLLFSSVVSYAILTFMTVFTGLQNKGGKMYLWFVIAALCAFLLVLTIVKFFKNLKAYKNDRSTVNKLERKKQAFFTLFNADSLPESMPAVDLAKIVSSLFGKQSDNVINDALRDLASTLNKKNNPSDPLCKNLNPIGDSIPARQRFYFRLAQDGYVFYDSDFAEPVGEIVCDQDDVLAFGQFSLFSDADKAVMTKAGKVHADSVIVKITDGTSYYFFDFQADSLQAIRKGLPGKKEL